MSRLIVALFSQELATRPDEDHWLFRVLGRQSDPSFEEKAGRGPTQRMAGSLFVTACGQGCPEGDLVAMARTPCKLYVGALRKTRFSMHARLTRSCRKRKRETSAGENACSTRTALESGGGSTWGAISLAFSCAGQFNSLLIFAARRE